VCTISVGSGKERNFFEDTDADDSRILKRNLRIIVRSAGLASHGSRYGSVTDSYEQSNGLIRFVIPVVFIINYNGVNLLSNTTIWYIYIYIYIYIIHYIDNNYMFRRLIMAIFMLYMNHLVSSYTIIYMGYLYGGSGG